VQVTGMGCDRGSWDPIYPIPDRWAGSAGRLYLTSLSLLTLEVYYRYLPLYRTGDTHLHSGPEEGGGPSPDGGDASVGDGGATELEVPPSEG